MKIGIIADDLTGANATGVRLAKAGFKSATIVFGGKVPANNSFTSISVDTDSRYTSVDVAKERVTDTYHQLRSWGADVVAKRIDSTIRGNIGSEIDALLEATGDDSIAVVVASYPDSGRITSGGYLLVEGVPVQETDVARDPLNPITDSYVPAVIAEQSNFEIGHIGLGTVLKGKSCIVPALTSLIAENKRIIVFDAVTNEEIEHIAESMAAVKGQVIFPVDPGPLSAAFGRVKARQSVYESKWIVTVGSVTPLTGRQLRYLIDKTNASPVYVDATSLATMGNEWEQEIKRATEDALDKLQHQETLIVTTYSPTSNVLPLGEIAQKENVTEEILAKRITTGLAKVTNNVINQTDLTINGTFSSGGDVTAALFAESKAEAIQLDDEVLPLAAYGKFIGGSFDGIPVVTKGGMVGNKQSIYACVNYLRAKNHEGSV
ncbi:four-carbon acid sugar kinase family protein [Sporosarcina sp. CAU 1771]